MEGHTHRLPPLTETQRARLTEVVELVTVEYKRWMMAHALEQPSDEVNRLKRRYHNFRAAFEEIRGTRGLRKGDRVRVFSGPHKGTEGTVFEQRQGAMLLVQWPEGHPLGRSLPLHAWQLELVETTEEEKEKEKP